MTQKERYERQKIKYAQERQRRHYKAEYERMTWLSARFVHKTYLLLKKLGMTDEEMRDYYAG